MKSPSTSAWAQHRAGFISLLVVTICYLWMTGFSDLLQLWTLIISLAVCIALMMQSIVDLLVWAFSQTASHAGATAGRSVRLFRRAFSPDPDPA